MLGWKRLGLVGILAISGASSWINCAFAQSITLDGSLGISGTLTRPNYVIEQSLGQTVSNNLFHSFGQFNLNSNEAAIFQSNPNIQNIISRVTGSNQSIIDGLIRTQNSGVNLLEARRSESTTELREATLKKPTPEVLVEAQGWVLNSYGEVELVAQAPSTHSSHSLQFASGCWR